MKKINILVIGNSFGEDATHYLHQIAKADGIDTKVVNLYIGGCSLKTHWDNALSKEAAYVYQINGIVTEDFISLDEALREEEWDYIVTQQASHDSGIEDTYEPYLTNLYQYVKEQVPNAEFLLQETWSYEIDSEHSEFPRYNKNQKEMYERLKACYEKAANDIGVRLIPCGDIIQHMRKKEPFIYENGGLSLCRDGFHMHFIYGRYLLAATWYEFIFKKNILENTYIPSTQMAPELTADLEVLQIIKEEIHKYLIQNS